MKVSIITCTFNSAQTVSDTINSVNNQFFPDIEHIIIDGRSTDNTLEIIKKLSSKRQIIISEKDEGMYDALNKGINRSTGEIVGLLHSDDFYTDNVFITKIVNEFEDERIEAVYSDVRFVNGHDKEKTVRYYSSSFFSPWMLRFGYMPAHPTFFTRRRNFIKYGFYKTNYLIAADYELLIRFLFKYRLTSKYIPLAGIKMRTGGVSTRSVMSNVVLNREIVRACKTNGVYTNFLMLMPKYLFKVTELILKRN